MKFSLTDFLGNMLRPETLVDPASFGDSLATVTSWEPLNSGGTNFRTHSAVQTGPNRVEFLPTTMMKIFPWFFAIIPLIVLVAVAAGVVRENGGLVFDAGLLIFAVVALGFGVATYFLVMWSKKAIIFDLDGTLAQTETLKTKSYANAAIALSPNAFLFSDIFSCRLPLFIIG